MVSTTFDFQRTGADILQLSDNHQPNFTLYELLTAENGLALSDRGYVMDKGTIRYQGTIKELRKNEEVRKKYLMV